MNNPTTAHDILAELEATLDKSKRTGDTVRARCPAHDDKNPSLDAKIGDKDCVILKCFGGCTTDAVVAALGWEMRDLFAATSSRRAPGSLQTYEWTNYLTGETVTQTRHVGDPKYRWPKGAKTVGLVYLARHDRTADRALVFAEGAKAATAAASKLPAADYDVIGFVSASKIPGPDTLTEISRGRSCIVWPDDDLPGARVATQLVSALRQAGADVVVVDPARLGLTGGHGHDAEEWHPGGSPGEELRAACGTAQPAPLAHFRSIWTYAAEATPVVLIPGLAWRGRVSKISSAPKLGKTSLLTNGIAAWQAGREFLGEPTGPPGSVLYVSVKPGSAPYARGLSNTGVRLTRPSMQAHLRGWM